MSFYVDELYIMIAIHKKQVKINNYLGHGAVRRVCNRFNLLIICP